VECDFGLISETDGDVVLHALADATLAAAGEPDIGVLFPPSEPRFSSMAGSDLIAIVRKRVVERGLELEQVDVTILAESPKLAEHYSEIRRRIGELIGLAESDVSVKARTYEGLGVIGEGKAIAASVVVMGVVGRPKGTDKKSASNGMFEGEFPLALEGEIPPKAVVVNVDGGSRGNPGPAAAAAVCRDEKGEVLFSESVYLGETTNNIAEYEGIRLALSQLSKHKMVDAEMVICLDSSLAFNQLVGRYRIKSQRLKELAQHVLSELRAFSNLRLKLIPREENRLADKAVNKLLDSYKK